MYLDLALEIRYLHSYNKWYNKWYIFPFLMDKETRSQENGKKSSWIVQHIHNTGKYLVYVVR